MHVKPTQKTTNLGSPLTFDVLDLRGRQGFPESQGGLVFIHKNPRRPGFTFVVRTDRSGGGKWRVDRLAGPLAEAVYGPNREDYFPTNTDAAKALAEHLED